MNNIQLFDYVSLDCSKSITKRYSTSFSLAIKVLHPDIQDSIYGIYGFVRLADEIVDTFHDYDKLDLLNKFRDETFLSISNKISLNPALNTFQQVVNVYGIRHDLIDSFFDSMFADLDKTEWTGEVELKKYIYGSAEVVGLMCLHVFCEGNSTLVAALAPAATSLGAAFQKINFLRDLKEDLYTLGRRYFGNTDFTNFDINAKRIIEADIQKDFQNAYKGICKLPIKARFGVFLAYKYYMCLFNKIKRLPPETILQKRIRVHNFQKVFLYVKATLVGRWELRNYSENEQSIVY